MMTDTVKTRIAEACDAARLSITDLAGLSGIDTHQLLEGDVTIQQIDQIAHITDADYRWLAGLR